MRVENTASRQFYWFDAISSYRSLLGCQRNGPCDTDLRPGHSLRPGRSNSASRLGKDLTPFGHWRSRTR